ncbi:Uncharacterised protein [uncultured archaeon]|nr:Uncharacterised protein [uncultured archaeon]
MRKPSRQIFELALKDLGKGPKDVAMKGILVKTGKYRADLAERSKVTPDLELESLANLALLI